MNAYTILLREKVDQSGIGSDLITEGEAERSSMYDFEYNPYDSVIDFAIFLVVYGFIRSVRIDLTIKIGIARETPNKISRTKP